MVWGYGAKFANRGADRGYWLVLTGFREWLVR